jgi:UDP-3-O-[3-hydroxymyristoyl] N-acetylglucosamine deacetylase
VLGEFTGFKSGHGLNNKLLRAILADKTATEVVSFGESQTAPIAFAPVAALA